MLTRAVLAATVAVVGVGAALVAVTVLHATRTAGAPPAAVMTGRAEFVALRSVVESSESARRAVVAAVDGVRRCSMDPAVGEQIARTAVAARQEVLGGIDGVDLSAVPGGSRLRSLVVRAMQTSIAADDDYASWMGDVAAGGCHDGSTTDPAYARALAQSSSATAAKQQLAATWNGLSSRYGLSPVDPSAL